MPQGRMNTACRLGPLLGRLRTILDVPERMRLRAWMQAPGIVYVPSRLLRTEVARVQRRDGRPLADGIPLLDRVGMFEITRETHTVDDPSSGTSRRSTPCISRLPSLW